MTTARTLTMPGRIWPSLSQTVSISRRAASCGVPSVSSGLMRVTSTLKLMDLKVTAKSGPRVFWLPYGS